MFPADIQQPSMRLLLPPVAANLIPLAAVLVLGWKLGDVMILFWAENGVIGLYTIARILAAGVRHPAQTILRLPVALFFCVHYGLFWFVHGVFVFGMFTGTGMSDMESPFARASRELQDPWLRFSLLGLLITHGITYILGYLLTGEFRQANPVKEMAAPYPRLLVLHVAVIAGGFAIVAIGQPSIAVILLILLKTVLDLGAAGLFGKLTSASDPTSAPQAATSAPASAESDSESPPNPK